MMPLAPIPIPIAATSTPITNQLGIISISILLLLLLLLGQLFTFTIFSATILTTLLSPLSLQVQRLLLQPLPFRFLDGVMRLAFPLGADPLVLFNAAAVALACALLAVAGLGKGERYIGVREGAAGVGPEQALDRPRDARCAL